MVERKIGEVPARLRRLEELFAAWRKTRVRGDRIPQSLWKSAAKLVTDFGLSQTSTVLKLDDYSLKRHEKAITLQARLLPRLRTGGILLSWT